MKRYSTSLIIQFSSVQSLSCVWLFATPCTAACQASLSITDSQSLLRLTSIALVMPSNQLILCHLLLLLPSIFPSMSLFKWVSSSHQVTKVLALQIQYPFFQWKLRDDCFRMTDLVSVLSKGLSRVFCSTTVWKHQFFGIQPYDPTLTSIHDYWKNHSFDYRTFVGKVISLLFNTMSRFIIAFLPRSKRLLILWLQSLSAVILEPKKIKSAIDSTFSPFICHEVMGPHAIILGF